MNPPEIHVATLVRAPREHVYDGFTQSEKLDAWFTTGAEVDPHPVEHSPKLAQPADVSG